jgi:hypothetical protein
MLVLAGAGPGLVVASTVGAFRKGGRGRRFRSRTQIPLSLNDAVAISPLRRAELEAAC